MRLKIRRHDENEEEKPIDAGRLPDNRGIFCLWNMSRMAVTFIPDGEILPGMIGPPVDFFLQLRHGLLIHERYRRRRTN